MPVGLVVKNGSNARSRTSRLMPAPESVTASMTYWPALNVLAVGRDIGFVEIGVRRLDGQRPPLGIASRALTARLRIAFSS